MIIDLNDKYGNITPLSAIKSLNLRWPNPAKTDPDVFSFRVVSNIVLLSSLMSPITKSIDRSIRNRAVLKNNEYYIPLSEECKSLVFPVAKNLRFEGPYAISEPTFFGERPFSGILYDKIEKMIMCSFRRYALSLGKDGFLHPVKYMDDGNTVSDEGWRFMKLYMRPNMFFRSGIKPCPL